MASSELITTAFTATSTAADVLQGVDLTGLRAIVTGASSGIGVETARALAVAGAEVTLAVRNTTAGLGIANMIQMDCGGARPHVARLDLTEQASVEDAGRSLKDLWHSACHIETDGEVGGSGMRGESYCVVEKDFVRAGLNQQRWEATKVGEQRADQRRGAIEGSDVVVGTPRPTPGRTRRRGGTR